MTAFPDEELEGAVADPKLSVTADDRSSVELVSSVVCTALGDVDAALAAPWTARNPVSPLAAAMLAISVARRARAAG